MIILALPLTYLCYQSRYNRSVSLDNSTAFLPQGLKTKTRQYGLPHSQELLPSEPVDPKSFRPIAMTSSDMSTRLPFLSRSRPVDQ
jgi:hypothetical protein